MKRLVLTALVLVVVYPLIADSSDSAGVKFDVEGLRSNWYVVPTGADLGFTLGSWKLVAGGGYEHLDFGRNATTGDPLTSDSNPYSWLTFPNGTLKLRHTWALDEVDLWAGAGATGYGNLGIGPPSAGEFVDLDANTYGFLKPGRLGTDGNTTPTGWNRELLSRRRPNGRPRRWRHEEPTTNILA